MHLFFMHTKNELWNTYYYYQTRKLGVNNADKISRQPMDERTEMNTAYSVAASTRKKWWEWVRWGFRWAGRGAAPQKMLCPSGVARSPLKSAHVGKE